MRNYPNEDEVFEPDDHEGEGFEPEPDDDDDEAFELDDHEESLGEEPDEHDEPINEEHVEVNEDEMLEVFEPNDLDEKEDNEQEDNFNIDNQVSNNNTLSLKEVVPHDKQGQETNRYNLRSWNTVSSNFKEPMDNPHSDKSYFPPTQLTQQGLVNITKYIFGHVMMQMKAKAGIKHLRQAAVAALMQEFVQLEDLGVYEDADLKLLNRNNDRGP